LSFLPTESKRKTFSFLSVLWTRACRDLAITADEAWKSTAYVKSGHSARRDNWHLCLTTPSWSAGPCETSLDRTVRLYVFEHGQDSRNKTSRQRIWYAFRAKESQYIITAREHRMLVFV